VVSLSNDLSLPNTNYLSQSYLLGLSHRTTRQLSLSGGYGYTYSNQQALAAYGSHNFYLNARYGWQWR